MKKLFLTAALAATMAAGASAQTPRWLRNPVISPDGTTVAFTYKGDIFTVPVSGGKARQITSNAAYDTAPVWSPDGKTIVFQSTREGSPDIYSVSKDGGTPVRLTTGSGSETPMAFLNDKELLLTTSGMPAVNSAHPPFGSQLYKLDVTTPGKRPELFLSLPVSAVSVGKNGKILYQDRKGVENVWRKHERSSQTFDIWMTDKGKFTKLTDFQGHDMNPVWKADGSGYYYISEQDGILNVYESSLDGKSRKQLTKFKKHPVRFLSASNSGTLAYSWDGDLYVQKPGGKPEKLNVELVADQYDGDRVKSFVNNGATYLAASPSGNELAFVIRGEVYVTDAKYKTTKRITDTPAQERVVSFSKDGRSLVYDSDRNGYWGLYLAKIKNPDEKQFAYATEIVEEPLYQCKTAAQQPQFSPDGTKVAFLENRTELKVIDVKSKKVTTVLPGKFNYSYQDGDISFEWSPDSNWLVISYIGIGGWNNCDIAMVKADGSEVVNLTESGYSNGNPKFGLDGKAVMYTTGKYGMKAQGSWGNQTDIVMSVLDGDAWDKFRATEEELAIAEKEEKAKKEKEEKAKKEADSKKDKKGKKEEAKEEKKPAFEPEFDKQKYRTVRLTTGAGSYGDYFLSPKGDKFYYVMYSNGGPALYVRDLKKGDNKPLIQGVSGSIVPDAKGENVFLIGDNALWKLDLNRGSKERIEFDAPYDRKPSLEREYMYDHMARQVNDKFYDKDIHGIDWSGICAHYREFLPYINNNQDYSILLSEVLGELNASHTGSGYRAPGARMSVAELGVFFDQDYKGDGLKIAEVLPYGPLAYKKMNVQPGDIIMSIDGSKILAGNDYNELLEGKEGKKTRLEIKRVNGKTDFIEMKPTSKGDINDELYLRWIERNQKMVDSLSNGRVGYVHIQGMDTKSYQRVYDQLLGKYRNCDAVIVDTRHNGGGWLHNDVARLFGGKEYVRFTPRGQYIGSEPFSEWYKPSAMLVNESNYSDAHGTPYTYQTLGLGKVIGAPVPGTMTAVWWETQIDPTLYFGIPQVTSSDMNGNALENKQLTPDIIVYNTPEEELAGRDAQIEAAVKHLLEESDKFKAKGKK